MKVPSQLPAPQPELSQQVDPRLWEAAKGMEANFLKELVRNMRKTVQEDPDTQNNRGLQIFRGMLDDEYAERAARVQGIGLAEMIVKQLLEQSQQGQGTVEIRDLSASDRLKSK